MTRKTVARHGDWKSPISQQLVTAGTKLFKSPRVSRPTGRAFFTESRPNFDMTIIEVLKDGVKEVLPDGYSAKNTIYNYGGAAIDALSDGRVIFSNEDDTVKILNPDSGKVTDLVSNPVLRYSEFSANDGNPWVLALEEDHTDNRPLNVDDRIVAISTETGEVRRIVEGADFYYNPEFSHDGTKLAWLEWDHPDMAWYGARLYWAEFTKDGWLGERHLVAGGLLDGVVEPRWGPDGSLFFGREVTNYRQLFRLIPGHKNAVQITGGGLQNAEFGEMNLNPGSHTYVPLSDKLLIAGGNFNGFNRLIAIDLQTGAWKQIAKDEEVVEVFVDRIARLSDTSILGIFSGTKRTLTVHIMDALAPDTHNRIVRTSNSYDFPDTFISNVEPLAIEARETSPQRTIHGLLWMPRNPEYAAESGELPPLIIVTHGGPTGASGPGLTLRTQYFTSRGYAVCIVNYSGSTGHGRAYRQSLWGNWGVLDTDDVVEVAHHLASTGRTRPGAVGCTGLSAGGYNTLMCVTRHPDIFAGAVAVSSISDLIGWDEGTHKLEFFYTDALVVEKIGASPDERAERYRERSAITHVDAVRTPLLILHGKKDTVVPLAQATDMADALEERGRDVRIVKVDNDGHMLNKPPSAKIWLDEEEKWWRKTLI